MAENEGAREAVLSRLRARLERLSDLVDGGAESRESEDAVAPASTGGRRSGLEAVFRAQERGSSRTAPIHASRRASA